MRKTALLGRLPPSTATPAINATKSATSYVSPFVGRLDDIQHVGMELVEQIVEIFSNYDIAAEVIVASVRSPVHCVQAAQIGADIATLPWDVLQNLAKHPLTDKGIQQFLADWEKLKER